MCRGRERAAGCPFPHKGRKTMAKVIRFNDYMIDTKRITWGLLIREDESPIITILYDGTAGLIIHIICSDFDQIEGLRNFALETAQKNATALFAGEPVTARPIKGRCLD